MDEPLLYAVIGGDVRDSLSPPMHNAAFKKYGINARYMAISKSSVEEAVEIIENLKIEGANITMPFKEKILRYLHRVEGIAARIGAVNTVLRRNNRLWGYNTDATGALRALQRFTEVKDSRVLIIGGGGAGKAIGTALAEHADVLILDRKEERVNALIRQGMKADKLNLENLEKELRRSHILINATPVGMRENRSLVPAEFLSDGLVVMDIVYIPLRTKLLRDALLRGCRVIDGLWMLAEQAAESFRIWMGIEVDAEYMRSAALEALR